MTIIPNPYVIERSSRGERSYDVYSRLLMDRIIFLGTSINDDVANMIIAQMLFLDADNPGRDIYLYLNSPGGNVSSGMAIYDTMQFLLFLYPYDCISRRPQSSLGPDYCTQSSIREYRKALQSVSILDNGRRPPGLFTQAAGCGRPTGAVMK